MFSWTNIVLSFCFTKWRGSFFLFFEFFGKQNRFWFSSVKWIDYLSPEQFFLLIFNFSIFFLNFFISHFLYFSMDQKLSLLVGRLARNVEKCRKVYFYTEKYFLKQIKFFYWNDFMHYQKHPLTQFRNVFWYDYLIYFKF
jgi:hypothetical protein